VESWVGLSFPRTSTKNPTSYLNKQQLPDLFDVENLQITTDGSHKDGKMEFAAVFDIAGQSRKILINLQSFDYPTSRLSY
jgi:hypothetical protein